MFRHCGFPPRVVLGYSHHFSEGVIDVGGAGLVDNEGEESDGLSVMVYYSHGVGFAAEGVIVIR